MILRAIELLHFTGDDFRHAVVSQMTRSVAKIEPGFELKAALPVIFDFQQLFPLVSPFRREAVCQAESHKLGQSWFITVRKVATFVPAVEAFDFLLTGQLWRSLTLPLDQSPNFRPMRRTCATRVRCFAHDA